MQRVIIRNALAALLFAGMLGFHINDGFTPAHAQGNHTAKTAYMKLLLTEARAEGRFSGRLSLKFRWNCGGPPLQIARNVHSIANGAAGFLRPPPSISVQADVACGRLTASSVTTPASGSL